MLKRGNLLKKSPPLKIVSVNTPSQQALDSFARELLKQINQHKSDSRALNGYGG